MMYYTLYRWQIPTGEKWTLKPSIAVESAEELSATYKERPALHLEYKRLRTPHGTEAPAAGRWVVSNPAGRNQTTVKHRLHLGEDYYLEYQVKSDYSVSGEESVVHRSVSRERAMSGNWSESEEFILTDTSSSLVARSTTPGTDEAQDMRQAYKRALFGEGDDGKEIPEYKKPWLDARYGGEQ